MISREITRQKDRLTSLFEKISIFEDLELKNHWTRYLCVLVSGFIENCIKELIRAYATNNASPKIVNFIEKKCNRLTNINHEKILQLLNSFSKGYGDHFESLTDDEDKDVLSTILSNRHLVAHGKDTPNITYTRLKTYYDKIIKLLKKIEKEVLEIQ